MMKVTAQRGSHDVLLEEGGVLNVYAAFDKRTLFHLELVGGVYHVTPPSGDVVFVGGRHTNPLTANEGETDRGLSFVVRRI